MRKRKGQELRMWREPIRDETFWLKRIGLGGIIILGIAYLFYRTLWAGIPLLGIYIPYLKWCSRCLKEEKNYRYLLQFRDFLQNLSGNLQAGESVETALLHTGKELRKEYGEQAFITRDVDEVVKQIAISGQTHKALVDWAARRESQELRLFVHVFLYGKKTGGDLCRIISRTAHSIELRVETRGQIHSLLSSKRYEQFIMSAMPLVILLYIKVANGDYLNVMYFNPLGVGLMSGCLLVYGGAVAWGMRILKIEGEV